MKAHGLIVRFVALLLASLPAVLLPTRGHAQAGSVDPGFNAGTGTNGPVNAVAVQPDGKIVFGGQSVQVNGTSRNNFGRLNADGSLDPDFHPGTAADGPVYAVAIQADGKIVIGGFFIAYDVGSNPRITRINADGTSDATFTASANYPVNSVAVQPDGKIVLGGQFTLVNGRRRNRIARLNADGSLDDTFNPGTGTSRTVSSVVVQGDGKIVIGGGFGAVNGVLRGNIARLNADGSLDRSFDPGTGADDYVTSVIVQADGKIVIGGAFGTVNGVARNRIARLNADGSLDDTFSPGTGMANGVLILAAQADGKIVFGGGYTDINPATVIRIARLNADGSLDASFQPGTGPDYAVAAVAVQADGKIVVGGFFNTFDGATRNYVARLNGDSSAVPPFFNGSLEVGNGFSYLPSFGYFKLLPQSPGYVYHNDLGFLFYIDAKDGLGGIYLYDFATPANAKSLGFLYTAPGFPFPYLYSFDLKTFLYYFPDTNRGAGFYTTAPRVFSRLDTGEFLFR